MERFTLVEYDVMVGKWGVGGARAFQGLAGEGG